VRLELREVVKHYRSEAETVRAVDGVSLAVEPGELVAIYGPSGSGKTTLLLIAGAMLSSDAGVVLAGGRVVSELSEAEAAIFRRDNVGFVFQSFHLSSSATVTDNAAIKLLLAGMSPARARTHAEPWLDRLGLGDRLGAMPGQLSAGQRQRVAIARALVNEPKLLLADEPTGSLDAERGRDVLGLLRDIARERGLPAVVVTHDPQAAEFADRALVLRDGQLTAAADSEPQPAVIAGRE
jgi:putative ABC transport system ATP-binding protein